MRAPVVVVVGSDTRGYVDGGTTRDLRREEVSLGRTYTCRLFRGIS